MLMSLPLKAEVLVDSAYIPAAPPSSSVLAAYMTLSNTGSVPRVITGVTADGFGMVHVHRTTVSDDGVSSMSPMHHLELGPGETVVLAPGGLHLMLMKPDGTALSRESVAVTLKFANGESMSVLVAIQVKS